MPPTMLELFRAALGRHTCHCHSLQLNVLQKAVGDVHHVPWARLVVGGQVRQDINGCLRPVPVPGRYGLKEGRYEASGSYD